MNGWVLDASALLAYLYRETGMDIVAGAIPTAVISSVNLAEVISKATDKGMPKTKIRVRIQNIVKLGLKIHNFDSHAAIDTGFLRTDTRKLGLSLADRACLNLGQTLNLPILTSDKAWMKLDQKEFWVLTIR